MEGGRMRGRERKGTAYRGRKEGGRTGVTELLYYMYDG